MLVALRVENFILIESLELRLEPGYNVLTGETGAGKSIVVGALGLVLGGRARADMVRPGAAEASIEALFDISADDALMGKLALAGINCDGELVIRRVVQANGRSRAYLNGKLCAARELTEMAHELADVTSQHECVALAEPAGHIRYLDHFAGLVKQQQELSTKVAKLRELDAQMRALRDGERQRGEREGYLRYQLDEIERLAPEPNELDELGAVRDRLMHAERLADVTGRTARALDPDLHGAEDSGICDELGRLVAELEVAAGLDSGLREAADDLNSCWSRLGELARELGDYADRLDSDPKQLENVQERIYQLEQLARRHGPTLGEVLEARTGLRLELEALAASESRLPLLKDTWRALMERTAGMARTLSKRRRAAASALGAAISLQLAELGMGAARVVVEVAPRERVQDSGLQVDEAQLGNDGIDRVQFLIAPNKGMQPRPLRRIASGGELSRALLALKRALGPSSSHSGVGIQVFDEVDAGVGGATADKIGQAIAGIADHRQVLCITHLAAIAAYADAHFVVTKSDKRGGTSSQIAPVSGKRRVAEITRMLTGNSGGRASSKAAAELINHASAQRAELAPAAQ